MGAAGLTSSSVEMSDKGGVGIEFDLDLVPVREEAMTPYEIMLSESQERMLMVLKPGREEMARGIFEKWELDFAIIGRVTDTNRLVLKSAGEIVCDIPVPPLVAEAPEYQRPWVPTPQAAVLGADDALEGIDASPTEALATLIGSPDLCSRRWVWEQYDHMVMGDTLRRPGSDAAIIRVHGTDRGLAITTDCTPRYCLADPVQGGRQAVSEAWRNLSASGARPLAITDNMNFGNPERPEIMGQFAGCIEGMTDACLALDFPVVSGNVSLYNETNGVGIMPTPAIGGVGLIDDLREPLAGTAFAGEDESILLIGETAGHLGQSILLRLLANRDTGAPPPVDLAAERRNGDFVRELVISGEISSCHDISDGGILIAAAEMALLSGIGAKIEAPQNDIPFLAWLFGEDQGRYLMTTSKPDSVIASAKRAGVPAILIGRTGGTELTVGDSDFISLGELKIAHENWLPKYMAAR
jgi:phosphoribosylformylglycinamidine synthase